MSIAIYSVFLVILFVVAGATRMTVESAGYVVALAVIGFLVAAACWKPEPPPANPADTPPPPPPKPYGYYHGLERSWTAYAAHHRSRDSYPSGAPLRRHRGAYGDQAFWESLAVLAFSIICLVIVLAFLVSR